MSEWQPIETAPKDGTRFIARQDGEIYEARYSKEMNLMFRIHALRVESKHRIVAAEMDGKTVRAEVPVEQPWPETFRHDWCFWTRGFEFRPKHWMPLPSPPDLEGGQ
jgi:hypothetical protein